MPARKAADSRPLLELSACSVLLDGHKVLDEIEFTLRAGERWALVGPNGSGKTLLLKMLRGDIWPTPSGHERRSYCFDGECSHTPAAAKQRIAYVGAERQDKYVRYGWNLTVSQVVTTGFFDEDIPLTAPSRAQRARVAQMLLRFGLSRLKDRRLLTLSYGQRRLALLARALVGPASVLLLDEVFNGLDTRAKRQLRHVLTRLPPRRAWILTSHRPKELPETVTHIARIEAGRITMAGPVKAVGRLLESSLERPREAQPAARRAGKRKMRRQQFDPTVNVPRDATPVIAIRGATLYRDYRRVIRDLDWTVLRGEHWAVLGAIGSGKSTLLSFLYGDLHPALGGTIERGGMPRGARIDAWQRRVGWVSPELQADHFVAKSIEQIVISGRHASVGLNAPPTAADRVAARRWLEFFGILALRERGPRQVSYGQLRLALLARAMVNSPQLLLLDEPCTGLDQPMRAQVLGQIERLAHRGTQLVLAVHDADDIVPAVRHVLRIERSGRVRFAGDR